MVTNLEQKAHTMAKIHTSLCALAVLSVGVASAQEPIAPPIAQNAAPAVPAPIEPPIQVPGSTPALPAGAADPSAPGLPGGAPGLPTAPALAPGAARLNDFQGDPID